MMIDGFGVTPGMKVQVTSQGNEGWKDASEGVVPTSLYVNSQGVSYRLPNGAGPIQHLLPAEVWQLLTELRRSGNEASHAFTGEREHALALLQFAWIVGVWLIRTFQDPAYERGEFVEPVATSRLDEVQALLAQAEEARAEARLAEVQAAPSTTARVIAAGARAATHLDLSEAQTRQLIDAQLREAGWEVDSVNLRYAGGARPVKGRSQAIAEWPTDTGPADYVLCLGMTPVGVVEAKRKAKAVMGSLEQVARYARGLRLDTPGLDLPSGLWGEAPAYLVPFLYATNGRPYLPQL